MAANGPCTNSLSRRRFLQLAGLTGAASILASCSPAPAPSPTQAPAAPAAKPAGATAAPAAPPATQAAQPKKGGTLNMSLGVDFNTFDPFFDVDLQQFKPMVFDAPLRVGTDGKFELRLAEAYEESADGTSATIRLRKGVKFHNGREMKDDDLVWSLDRAKDESLGHQRSDIFKDVQSDTKVDDYTVKVVWKMVKPDMQDAFTQLWIYPKEAATDIAKKPVGTGPFKFQEWVPGDHTTLVRFDDYWQKDKGEPYLDKLQIKPIPDPQSRVMNLQGGSIDFLMDVPLAQQVALSKASDLNLFRQPPGLTFYCFIMNVTRPPFDNQKVRQAMNYAVDRSKIATTVFAGQGLTTLLPYPTTSWAYAKDLENYYTFNPDKAKSLLAEAGFPNGFKFKLLIRGNSGVYLDQAQVYKEDLAKVGVQAEIVPIELAQYWPKLYASDFDMVSHGTGSADLDPSGLFQQAACCRPFRNFFKITEDKTWFPQYFDLINKAQVERDQTKRAALYHQVLEIYLREGWVMATAWNQMTYAFKKTLNGFRTDTNGDLWLDGAWLS